MTVKELLEVCPALKVKVRVVKERKVKSNIIENQAPIALNALSGYYLNSLVKNVYIEIEKQDERFKPLGLPQKKTLIINIEEVDSNG